MLRKSTFNAAGVDVVISAAVGKAAEGKNPIVRFWKALLANNVSRAAASSIEDETFSFPAHASIRAIVWDPGRRKMKEMPIFLLCRLPAATCSISSAIWGHWAGAVTIRTNSSRIWAGRCDKENQWFGVIVLQWTRSGYLQLHRDLWETFTAINFVRSQGFYWCILMEVLGSQGSKQSDPIQV